MKYCPGGHNLTALLHLTHLHQHQQYDWHHRPNKTNISVDDENIQTNFLKQGSLRDEIIDKLILNNTALCCICQFNCSIFSAD
jgi:hypothetical protein